MRFRVQLLILACIPLWLLACGDDDNSSGPGSTPSDFSGIWEVDGEVISKNTCNGNVGDPIGYLLLVVQRGGDAQLLLENSTADLIVDGSRAHATIINGDVELELELQIEGGELTGTDTRADSSVPCTEVSTLTAVRVNDPPHSGFEGYWELELEATQADCVGDEVGAVLNLCRRIRVESNTVWLEDEEGPFLGIGDGTSMELRRFLVDDWTRIDLTLENGGLTGSLSSWDPEESCELRMDVVGTRRVNPCGEQEPPTADFSGYWNFTSTEIVNDCGLPISDDCEWITQVGSAATLQNDGVSGVVQGNTFLAHREEPLSDTVTIIVDIELELSTDGNSWTGTRSVEFVDSENPQADCVTSTNVVGTRTEGCPSN